MQIDEEELAQVLFDMIDSDCDTNEIARAAIAYIVPKVRDATLEDAAKVAEAEAKMFLSEQYAIGQPNSSAGERFACGHIAGLLRNMKDTQP